MADWYEKSFGEDYLMVYKHRDVQGAHQEVSNMMEWLQLKAGAQVLDLCCGMGRHSKALAEAGYQVTGVDLSDVLLTEARRLDTNKQIRWIKGDMREVPLQETFDAVLSLFTSFGYFDTDQENEQVLHEIYRLLKPGGVFIIDFLNPSYIKANLVASSERKEGAVLIQEKRTLEEGYVRKRITIVEENQPERYYLEQVRLYGLPEWTTMLEKAGLQLEHIYGAYDASEYSPSASPRIIMKGRRKPEVST